MRRMRTGCFSRRSFQPCGIGGRTKMNRDEKCNVFVNETEVGGKCY